MIVYLIYFLKTVSILGLFVTIFWFLKSFASVSSLTHTVNETAKETPVKDLVTGGLFSTFRVLRHGNNRHAKNTLLKNVGMFLGSFVITMGAALLMVHLNTKHCAFNMTKILSDGTEVTLCETEQRD